MFWNMSNSPSVTHGGRQTLITFILHQVMYKGKRETGLMIDLLVL